MRRLLARTNPAAGTLMSGSAARTIVRNPRTMLNRRACRLSVLAEAHSTATCATGASCRWRWSRARLDRPCTNAATLGAVSRDQSGVGVPHALGKQGCGMAVVNPPGPDDQAMHLHEVIVEALQPQLGLASDGDRIRARRYAPGP